MLQMNYLAGLGVCLVALSAGSLAYRDSSAAGERSVWDGVYSAAQAERGLKILAEQCALCHGESMSGGGGVPSAVGPEFMFNWNGRSVGELFEMLRTTMPPTAPGSLSDQGYADAMAALFKRNGFPASEIELQATEVILADITILRERPQD